MSPTQRRANSGLIQQLFDEPFRFQFFQAVRLVVSWLAENGVQPDKALVEFLRFDNSVSLGFPASQIEKLEVVGTGVIGNEEALLQALHESRALLLRLTPTFLGLLGANGALPRNYTERIQDYQSRTHDTGPKAFLDMFSNRVVALFYEAWRKYRIETALWDRKDIYLPLLCSLAGRPDSTLNSAKKAIPVHAIALYAGVLQQGPISSAVMARVMSEYFGAAITIEEAVGHMNAMSVSEQSTLDGKNAVLGETAVLGTRMWRPDLRARVVIGPLCKADYDRFLPRTPTANALREMLGLFGNPTVTYEVELILQAADVTGMCIKSEGAGVRLGFDTFLVIGPSATNRSMKYELNAMAPLAPLSERNVAPISKMKRA